MLSDVISRKNLHSDVEDLVFRYRGETRIGREFNYTCELSEIDQLLEIQNRFSNDRVVFPDKKHQVGDNRICLSVSADRVSPFSGKPRSFNELYEPVDELHRSGFLHLGITSDSYMMTGDSCVLMAWGDSLLSPAGMVSPEMACGGFPCEGSDYFQLGCIMASRACRIWDGSGAPDLRKLKHWRLSTRLEEMGRLSCRIPRISLPASNSFKVVRGGSWKERDVILNEYLCSAGRRGWQTAVIRCRIQESHRPLPGLKPGNRIDSPHDLIENTFTRIEGVSRLLVVDQIDYASEDFKAVLQELSDTVTSNLAVIISSCSDELSFYNGNVNILQLENDPSFASVLDPLEMLDMKKTANYPFRSGSSFQFRTDHIDSIEKMELSSRQLFDEGAFRFLLSEEGRNLIKPDDQYILEDSLIELGMLDEALGMIPGDNHVKRGIVYHKKADYHAAVVSFEKAIAAGFNPSSPGLPYVSSLVEIGERDRAKEIIRNMDDIESIVYLAWILDCDGNIREAFSVLEEALSRTVSEKRIPLLTSKGGLFLRTGEFDKALITINEAKMLSDNCIDVDQKLQCHIALGRILESIGLWQDALDNYRIATNLKREANDPEYIERLVHRYVLEFRMGNIRLARNTLQKIKSIKRAVTSKIYQQRVSMIEAYSGVMLCQGQAAMKTVNRALSLSSELKRALMTGICMMYKGKLLVQSKQEREGQKFLEQAKAIGSSLGDKYLIIASELGLCYIQKPMNPDDILKRTREINLKQMELEAAVIFGTGEQRDKAFEDILDLPDPLKACELATCFGFPVDIKLRNRLLSCFRSICEMLDKKDLKLFRKAHPDLQKMLERAGTDCELPEISTLRNQLEYLSEWIQQYTSGNADISDLCDRFGLNCSEKQPPGNSNSVRIKLQGGEPLFITGDDLSGVDLLEPVISSVMGICQSVEQPQKTDMTGFPEIIARSEIMVSMKHRMKKVAKTRIPVLITGETGTGKDLVANAIHRAYDSSKPFVAVDCGAIPESLIETELFGSARGSYTDSKSDRQGLIESSNGGTLFLDEIGNMPLQLQAKLLRVLETGVLRRVGETTERNVEFRLISATNSDLCNRISSGEFRSDLYYRVAVMIIDVPPLRNRIEDIPLLVRYCANQISEPYGKPPTFLKSSISKLSSYSWPGNVRELRNVVQRAILLSNGRVIRESDITFENTVNTVERVPAEVTSQKLDDVVTKHVYRVYSKLKNKIRAAEVLDCDPKTVTKYVNKYEENYK